MANELIEHGEAIVEFGHALTPELCAEIIDCFEHEPGARPGVVFRPDGSSEVDAGLKTSTDFLIQPDSSPRWLAIDRQLNEAMQRALAVYAERFFWLPRLPTTFCSYQIQRTQVGQGFDWHADEDGRRRLALIFYLNDDFEGGATEFVYQRLNYQPKAGSLLMFPPYWTHVHRGRQVTAGTKYIATSFLLHAPRG